MSSRPPVPPALLQSHRKFNRNSADGWQLFADHRSRVTALLLEQQAAPQSGRLAVLGAGNCNDLDLPALSSSFTEVHLVDLDSEALTRGLARLPPELTARLTKHAPVDVTGALHRLAEFRGPEASGAALEELLTSGVRAVTSALPGNFDVVLSTGLLSQIMHTCRLALGDAPSLQAVAHMLALAHMRALLALCRPGGRAVLVTDTVSSETYPLEELWADKPPLAHLDHLEATDNLFTGTAPKYLRRQLTRDPELARMIQPPVRLVEPWLWRLGPNVTLVAYAFVAKRK